MSSNILSLDIGGSKIVFGLVTEKGKILYKQKYEIASATDKEGLLRLIHKAFAEFKQNSNESYKSAGVTIPGLADAKNGIWVLAPFSGINNFHIVTELSALFGCNVYIENDVNACAIAEHTWGACKDTNDFAWITISNGCGGSVFANGKLYGGAFNNSGEVGHIIVDEDTDLQCGCGNIGCFEAVAAGPGVGKRYCKLKGIEWNGKIKSKEVSEFARMGDSDAIKVFEQEGYYIGKVLACVANILNPEKIVLGGGVALDFDLFENKMVDTYNRMVFKKANHLKIIKTELGYDAALLGAASLAL